MIKIEPVTSSKERMTFIKFPWRIYQGDPNWVPPLIIDMKKMLDPQKNPFFLHSKAELFLARRNGEVVGRIAAILNNNHNRFHNEKTAFFGFFECINDPDVAAALLERVEEWGRQEGMTVLRGPMNFSTNDTCAFLIDGFDSPPVLLMTYNPRYYIDLVEQAGYQKAKDLYAYFMDHTTPLPRRIIEVSERAMKDEGLTLRSMNMKDFDAELQRVKMIYNSAWEKNWGFVPMTDEEFEHMAKELKPIVDPDLIFFAEVDGEPAGFSLTLPDYNQILRHINGRLLPFGIVKLLLGRRKINGVRVLTLGVVPKFQRSRAIAPAFYRRTYEVGTGKGHTWGEFSWILEDNLLMNRALKLLGARHYKTYRIYEKPL
jgi:GNAT superfamily N-acetyltransferase